MFYAMRIIRQPLRLLRYALPVVIPWKLESFARLGKVHQWMYDEFSLTGILQNTGFCDIRRCAANESVSEYFNRILLDIDPDGSLRKPDSLFLEAGNRDHEKDYCHMKVAIVNTYKVQESYAGAPFWLHSRLCACSTGRSMLVGFQRPSE